MPGFARSVVAVAVLLGASDFAHAQREVAPAPHPTLDEVVKEYKRWDLPLPEPEAQLVRLRRVRWPGDFLAHEDQFAPDKSGFNNCLLAFRDRQARLGTPAGDVWVSHHPGWVVDAIVDRPTAADADAIDFLPRDWLQFSVAFRLRGWDEAATAAYALGRKRLAESEPDKDEPPPTVMNTLHGFALGRWYSQLLEPRSDRREVLNRLRELIRIEPHFRSPRLDWVLKNLEATLVPRKSKPGSVAARVDELTDYWEDDWTGERRDAAYWKLAELGFDAVPTLIEHLTDDRLTRAQFRGFNNFWPFIYRVKHLVSRLLVELSGGRLDNFEERGDTLDPGEALKWWGTTREIDEENWLLDHVLPVREEKSRARPREVVLRTIRAKYPHRLREVYWAVLLKRPDVESERITAEIGASTLPRERKVALLEQGALHRDIRHRVSALKALARIDAAVFRKHYTPMVQALPAELPPNVGEENEIDCLGVVCATSDRKSWDELLAASRRMTPSDRLRVIDYIQWSLHYERTARGYREGVRYLLGFREDTATGELDDKRQVVRDHAAAALASLLNVTHPLAVELPQSPRERSLFRERVWGLAERELARPAK